MAFKLVVADVVDVPLNFNVNDAGKSVNFAFSVQAKRVAQDKLRAMVEDEANASVADFLAEHVIGWRGQRLVLDDDGKPAEFSAEALACMLGLIGVSGLMLGAYLEACGAKGKAKN